MKIILYFIQDYHYILALLLFVFAVVVVVKDHYIYIWFSVLQSYPQMLSSAFPAKCLHIETRAGWGTQ